MARTALRGRLTWQRAELVEAVAETPRVKTIVFDVPGWPGHRAGQHVDVPFTAQDGYQAERSYSIASDVIACPQNPHKSTVPGSVPTENPRT
jgi:ferredoxin-NADP reductase